MRRRQTCSIKLWFVREGEHGLGRSLCLHQLQAALRYTGPFIFGARSAGSMMMGWLLIVQTSIQPLCCCARGKNELGMDEPSLA